jgi:hypothetical protein
MSNGKSLMATTAVPVITANHYRVVDAINITRLILYPPQATLVEKLFTRAEI